MVFYMGKSTTFRFPWFILVLTVFRLGNGQEVHKRTIPSTELYPSIVDQMQRYLGYERVLYHDGLVRWFVEHPPPQFFTTNMTNTSRNSNATNGIPLLIMLHFGRGNMRSSQIFGRIIEKDPWLRLAEQDGYLVLAPNAVVPRKRAKGYNTHNVLLRDTNWNDLMGGRYNATVDVDDVGFITKLVEWAIQNRNVDPKRVYIVGHSSGGNMVQRMVIDRPTLFAAAAASVATLPDREIPFPSHGTPIVLFLATNDNRVPYEGGYKGGRGQLMSAEATRDYFVAMNGAGPMIETTLADIDPNDNCTIISQYFPHNTTPVLYYKLVGGGHNFAGEKTFAGFKIPKFAVNLLEDTLGTICFDADASELAWDFMTQFTLQA